MTALTMDFVRNLSKAIRTLRAYSPTHRQAQAALSEAFGTLTRMLEATSPVLLGTRDGALIVQGKPVHDAAPAAQGFCEMLSSRNIATFAVQRGVTVEEFSHLVKILSMSPEDLLEANSIKPEHLKPFRSIRVNEMRFVAIDGSVPEGEAVALAAGGAAVGNLMMLVNSLLAGRGGEPGDAAQFQALGAAMQSLTGDAGRNEAVRAATMNFDQIVERCMANIPASRFVEEYLKGVGTMPEEVKRAILETTGAQERAADPDAMIERLPLAMRGRIVAEDLSRGVTDRGKLREAFRRLAPSPQEFVRLMDVVARLLAESASSADEARRKSAELHDLLPLSGEMKIARPTVLLLIRDRQIAAAGRQAMEEIGLSVTVCRRPDEHLGTLLRARTFDAAVIDISPYRLNQLEFLRQVMDIPSPPPLFMIEDVLTVRQPSELNLYPQGTVLYKPLEPQKLAETVRESVPAAGAKLPPPPAPEEDESARHIQRELVPSELPHITGYSLAVRHEPGSSGSGNYHDVLPLPGRLYGLLMIDVAGSPAACLAALLTARTNSQRILVQSSTPSQALGRLNDLLAGAVPRGTFARAVCAYLDPAAGQLTLAAGGHPRPMRWSRAAPAVRLLQTSGAPLGLAKGAEFLNSLRPASVTLSPGDHVLFHTPGVANAANAKGEDLGERGIARAMLGAPEGPAGLALVEVLEAVLRHQGEAAEEDFTVMELRREAVQEEMSAA